MGRRLDKWVRKELVLSFEQGWASVRDAHSRAEQLSSPSSYCLDLHRTRNSGMKMQGSFPRAFERVACMLEDFKIQQKIEQRGTNFYLLGCILDS